MNLYCCLCLHSRPGPATEAATVINGQAVCMDHVGYAQGWTFSQMLAQAMRDERSTENPAN